MRIVSLSVAAVLAASTFATFTHAETTVRPVAMAEEGHKHAEDEKQKLGRQKVGEYTVSVIMIGDLHDDKEVEFDVKLIDAKADPKAIRIWIGVEDGKGSEKAALTKKTTTFVGTAKVPSPVPDKSKVWVEIETDSGVVKGSLAMEDKHKH